MTQTTPSRRHADASQPGWAAEMSALLDAYRQAGGEPNLLQQSDVATLAISGNDVLASHDIPGIHLEAETSGQGVRAHIHVEPNSKIERPVHLCFGVVPAEGRQEIMAEYDIGSGAQVDFLAHCSFPNAMKVEHTMQARIHVGVGAALRYTEQHYHGPNGGVVVKPRAEVTVEADGQFVSTFGLTRGRAGRLEADYQIAVADRGLAELITKIYGHGDDHIHIQETVRLNGEQARGLTRTRVAVRQAAVSQVFTTMEGNAAGARGHMDCIEIVRDQGQAQNRPLVVVRNEQAQVTHEAAIGTVSRKELESLLARGLNEDEAVDLIIRGMIR